MTRAYLELTATALRIADGALDETASAAERAKARALIGDVLACLGQWEPGDPTRSREEDWTRQALAVAFSSYHSRDPIARRLPCGCGQTASGAWIDRCPEAERLIRRIWDAERCGTAAQQVAAYAGYRVHLTAQVNS